VFKDSGRREGGRRTTEEAFTALKSIWGKSQTKDVWKILTDREPTNNNQTTTHTRGSPSDLRGARPINPRTFTTIPYLPLEGVRKDRRVPEKGREVSFIRTEEEKVC